MNTYKVSFNYNKDQEEYLLNVTFFKYVLLTFI